MIKICGCLVDEVLIRIVVKLIGGGVLVRIYFKDVYVSCDIYIYVVCKVERVYKL